MRSLALISSHALSLHNFRGPLIRALVSRGVRVFALAPDHDEKSRAALAALGAEPVDISMERTGMRAGRDILDLVRLALLLRRLKPDAVFGYFIKAVIYGSIAAWIAGVPRGFALVAGLGHVFAAREGTRESRRARLLRGIVSRLYGLAFRTCEHVFLQNEDDLAFFVDSGLLERDKAVRLNGTGVDLDAFQRQPLPGGPPLFLMMARLLREKGVFEFAEAARRVKSRFPSTRFVLLGGLDINPGGISRSDVEGWVREGVLEWPGHVDDVRPWIEQCSVYVLPSFYREGVPRSTQEALAIGRPIITTDAVGCRETVIDGSNGYLVPVRDSEALANAMLRFLEQPELNAVMGAASRRLAEERFDVRSINRIILSKMGFEEPAAGQGQMPSDCSDVLRPLMRR